MQTTLKSTVTFTGKGLHSGREARVTLRPASAEHGIWFRRTDVRDAGTGADPMVPALWHAAQRGPLCTAIANADGTEVATIEHLMAALVGCGVSNALIDIDGPEVPILDGSAEPFVRGILGRGLRRQHAPLRAIEVLRPVEVRAGAARARLDPAPGFAMRFDIDFDEAAIGRQSRDMSLANGAFVHELMDSRTFCRRADVDAMHAAGLALGGTYENAVVFEGDRVLSPGGLRHGDEPVRHKMLDAVGDLALAGGPILGRYTGDRAGHAITNELLRALFADPAAFRMVDVTPAIARVLPGAGVTRADLRI
ncbi:MAG: UDP-3-O-acyl-N-acetylglucosamine deacetylase [Shimia sp.]